MHKLLLVGVGGFFGALLRYSMSGYIQNMTESIAFPHGTLAVNVTGCLLIDILSQLFESHAVLTAEFRLLLMVGFLGSFTTYSTFGNETMNLLHDQRFIPALVNIGTHLIFGLSAVLLGRFTIIAIWR